MRIMSATLACVVLAALVSGCQSSKEMSELSATQVKQAKQMDEITTCIKKQQQGIKQVKDEIAKFAAKIEAKSREGQSGGADRQAMLAAALLLVQKGSGNIPNQAIPILGALGGKDAENALLGMVENASSRNLYLIVNTLASMRCKKLNGVILKLLNSDDDRKVYSVTNVLNSHSTRIFTKKDLPELEKALVKRLDCNNNSSRGIRNALLNVICRLDLSMGIKYICDALEDEEPSRQRETLYLLNRNNLIMNYKSWKQVIDAIGEPNQQNYNAFQVICDGISRNGDWRLTDLVLPWAEYAMLNRNFKYQYITMLNRLRDPKAAEVLLDLLEDDKSSHNRYRHGYPGIVKKKNEYQLVDAAAMEILMTKRAKRIARLNERDKRIAARKKK
jgi:hypothetical protein